MSSTIAARIHIATTEGIAGLRIAAILGVAVGIAIRSRGVDGNIMAGLDALGACGALDEYRGILVAARREALARMAQEAEGLGANAVVGMRFDTAEVGREMVEVVAYGTAVVLQDSRREPIYIQQIVQGTPDTSGPSNSPNLRACHRRCRRVRPDDLGLHRPIAEAHPEAGGMR